MTVKSQWGHERVSKGRYTMAQGGNLNFWLCLNFKGFGSNCYLPGSVGDSRTSRQTRLVPCPRNEKCLPTVWLLALDTGSGWGHTEILKRPVTREIKTGANCAYTHSCFNVQVTWSCLTCFWWQAEEKQWLEITQICLTLPVWTRLSNSTTPAPK